MCVSLCIKEVFFFYLFLTIIILTKIFISKNESRSSGREKENNSSFIIIFFCYILFELGMLVQTDDISCALINSQRANGLQE